jgi:hypothetical protein
MRPRYYALSRSHPEVLLGIHAGHRGPEVGQTCLLYSAKATGKRECTPRENFNNVGTIVKVGNTTMYRPMVA